MHEVPSLTIGQTDRIRILLERFDLLHGAAPEPARIVWDDGPDGHEFTAAQARSLAASLNDAALRLELSDRV